jgi:hypothetical protein
MGGCRCSLVNNGPDVNFLQGTRSHAPVHMIVCARLERFLLQLVGSGLVHLLSDLAVETRVWIWTDPSHHLTMVLSQSRLTVIRQDVRPSAAASSGTRPDPSTSTRPPGSDIISNMELALVYISLE